MSRTPARRTRLAGLCAAGSVVLLALVAPIVGAQVDPGAGGTSTTVVPLDPVPTSTTIPGTTTTKPEGPNASTSTTSTVPQFPSTIPPAPEDDPFVSLGEERYTGDYGSQGAFDLSTKAVLVDRVVAASIEFDRVNELLSETLDTVSQIGDEIAQIEKKIVRLGEDSDLKVQEANEARALMVERATEAFIRGDSSLKLILALDDPLRYSSASSFLEALAQGDHEAMQSYQAAAAELNAEELAIAEELEPLARALSAADADVSTLLNMRTEAEFKLRTYEAGSHVYVPGLVFPILGEVHYIDSWGFDRLPGSALSHWHEGIDIMAPVGRELVAVEDGVLERIGTAGLGGNRLWLRGDSGTDYYYAHLSGYVAGVTDGQRVVAGQMLAYVGDSGSASGGPPHLHFQIHPGGEAERPVNPFPILQVAYEPRRNLTQAEALAGRTLALPSLLAELPARLLLAQPPAAASDVDSNSALANETLPTE